MKFFIPAVQSVEQGEWVYASIKALLGRGLSARFSERRICFLRWWQNGGEHVAEVGKPTSFNGEMVIAILHEPSRNLYHVCTPNRGVIRDLSIVASDRHVTETRDFEAGTITDDKGRTDWSQTQPLEDVIVRLNVPPEVLSTQQPGTTTPRLTV